MASALVTITGNACGNVELKHIGAKSTAVAEFTVASTPRVYDKNSGDWKDGDTAFVPVKIWGRLAEDATDKISKGTPVIVSGKLTQENFESKGEKRSVFKLVAEEVGVSVRAKVEPF